MHTHTQEQKKLWCPTSVSNALIKEAPAIPLSSPLSPWQQSSLKAPPCWPSHGCQGYNLSHSTGGDRERDGTSLSSPGKENNIWQYPDWSVKPLILKLHVCAACNRSEKQTQQAQQLWLCKWPISAQRPFKTKTENWDRRTGRVQVSLLHTWRHYDMFLWAGGCR